MNIRLVISNYKNKDGKSKVLFDCSENTYRKKINTGVRIQKFEKWKFLNEKLEFLTVPLLDWERADKCESVEAKSTSELPGSSRGI